MGLGKGIGKELDKWSGIVAGVGLDKKVDNEEELGKIAEVERELDNEEVAIVDEDTGVWLDWWVGWKDIGGRFDWETEDG